MKYIATWNALAGGDTLTFCTGINNGQPTTADVDTALQAIRQEIASWPKYNRSSGISLPIPPVLGLQLTSVAPLLPNATFEQEEE